MTANERKLWCCAQWGCAEDYELDGANGRDTCCIVSAVTVVAAIACATEHFRQFSYKDGQPDIVCLIGSDADQESEDRVVVARYVQFAYQRGKYATWQRFDDEWMSDEEWCRTSPLVI